MKTQTTITDATVFTVWDLHADELLPNVLAIGVPQPAEPEKMTFAEIAKFNKALSRDLKRRNPGIGDKVVLENTRTAYSFTRLN